MKKKHGWINTEKLFFYFTGIKHIMPIYFKNGMLIKKNLI